MNEFKKVPNPALRLVLEKESVTPVTGEIRFPAVPGADLAALFNVVGGERPMQPYPLGNENGVMSFYPNVETEGMYLFVVYNGKEQGGNKGLAWGLVEIAEKEGTVASVSLEKGSEKKTSILESFGLDVQIPKSQDELDEEKMKYDADIKSLQHHTPEEEEVLRIINLEIETKKKEYADLVEKTKGSEAYFAELLLKIEAAEKGLSSISILNEKNDKAANVKPIVKKSSVKRRAIKIGSLIALVLALAKAASYFGLMPDWKMPWTEGIISQKEASPSVVIVSSRPNVSEMNEERAKAVAEVERLFGEGKTEVTVKNPKGETVVFKKGETVEFSLSFFGE